MIRLKNKNRFIQLSYNVVHVFMFEFLIIDMYTIGSETEATIMLVL